MKPELKTKTDQKSLWKNMDIIDTIGTDHAPHTKKEKKQPIFGVPGLETMLPLLLNEVNKNKLTLTQVVKLTSTNAAKIFNLNKGKIKPGYDADLTIIDLKKEKYVNNKDLKTKCKWSPFHKRKLKGWPIITILKGKIIWRDNND